jgi:hypothetical protein
VGSKDTLILPSDEVINKAIHYVLFLPRAPKHQGYTTYLQFFQANR